MTSHNLFWPGGARLAVSFSLMFEAGGQPISGAGGVIGSDFVDHTLPPGRPQGPSGPAQASKGFLTAVPDLKVAVVQRLVVDDRVISHLRFTGHFTGTFLWGTHAPANRWISSQPTSCACAMGGSRTTGIWKTISHSSNKSAWWRAANGMLEVPVM